MGDDDCPYIRLANGRLLWAEFDLELDALVLRLVCPTSDTSISQAISKQQMVNAGIYLPSVIDGCIRTIIRRMDDCFIPERADWEQLSAIKTALEPDKRDAEFRDMIIDAYKTDMEKLV